ncbi:hypothetical protein SRHO_G00177570 [Serrasalmus rhombeus]
MKILLIFTLYLISGQLFYFKDGFSVSDVIGTTETQKDRFSISDDRRSKVLRVRISDVREADGGVYFCRVPVHVLPTPVQRGLMVKGSHGWPPSSPMRVTVCSLFQIVWAESCRPYCPANLDYKSVENSLRYLSTDRVRNRSSWGVVFLGRPLCSLSLTSPVIWNLAFNLEMVLGLTPNNAGFVEHQLEVARSQGPCPDQSNVACRFLEQTPTDHCSRVHAHRCCQSGANQGPDWEHLGVPEAQNKCQ